MFNSEKAPVQEQHRKIRMIIDGVVETLEFDTPEEAIAKLKELRSQKP